MRRAFSLPLIGLFLTACISPSYATDVSGPVSGTWSPSGSPYNVIGQVWIPAGQELVIEPGVQVIFQGWYKFLIYGRLQAIGTEADSILFTAADTSHGWHGLRFYDINTQPDSSRLVYCKITYGRSSGVNSAGDDKHGGAIFCSNTGKLRIEHCLIAHNRTADVVGAPGAAGTGSYDPGDPGESVESGDGGAIYLRFSSPLILDSRICYNRTGSATGGAGGNGYTMISPGGAIASDGGPGGDGKSGQGGAIFMISSAPGIDGNVFADNFTGDGVGGAGGAGGSAFSEAPYGYGEAYGGTGERGGNGQVGSGGAIFMSASTAILHNNLFHNEWTGNGIGGCGGNGGNADAYGYYMAFAGSGGDGGNGSGGDGAVLGLNSSSPTASNNTLADNQCGIGRSGSGGLGGWGWSGAAPAGAPGLSFLGEFAVHCHAATYPVFANCIIWNNPLPIVNTSPLITYSCVQGGYFGPGNINLNPEFVGTSLGDYFLSQFAAGQSVESPCVDAGNPDSCMVVGTTRTDGVLDSGIVDMGYHYPGFVPQPILALSATALSCTAAYGGTNPEDLSFAILNVGTGSLIYQVTENTDWLSASPVSGGPVSWSNPDTITVAIDIVGLPLGTYGGDLTVTAPGASGSPAYVHVSLCVGQSSLQVSPISLSFVAGIGGTNPPNQIFNISNAGVGGLLYTIEENVDWATVTPMAGGPVPPQAVTTVMVDISGLAIGNYQGDIIVISPPSLGSPDTVHVSLFIGQPILAVDPDSLVFSCYAGGANPTDQHVSISNQGTGVLYFEIQDTVSWLSVSPLNGGPVPPQATIAVQVDNAGLGAGTYEADLQVAAPGAIGSPHPVHVTLNVIAGLSGPLAGTFTAGTYYVFEDIMIITGTTATLEPGVIFLFEDDCDFTIYGTLTAIGTESDSIKFMHVTPDTGWGGIRFNGINANSSRLEFCLITGSQESGILFSLCSPQILHSTIIGNGPAPPPFYEGGGLRCVNISSPLISHCLISNNWASRGGGIACLEDSSPMIEFCRIIDNNSFGWNHGGGVYVSSSNPSFWYCTFSGNFRGALRVENADSLVIEHCEISDNSGAPSIDCYITNLTLIYDLISNNSFGAIEGYGLDLLADHCTMYGNTFTEGGVLKMYGGSSRLFLTNSIIAENHVGYGAALYIDQIDTIVISYCDFFGNTLANLWGDRPPGFETITTTNANGDSCDAYYDIFLDPQFVNPDSGDYHLMAFSPCVDAGDPNSPLDPDSTCADMGAFYYDHLNNAAPVIISYFPEANDTVGLGDLVDFGINAVDPNGDSLSFLWLLNGISISFDSTVVIAFDSIGIYEVRAYVSDGQLSDSTSWTITVTILGIAEKTNLPNTFFHEGNHPNPFNAATTIKFGLPVACWVKVEVYDIAGRAVSRVGFGESDLRWYPAGVHEVTFDGSHLASGIYICRIQAGEFSSIKKMVLLK